MRVNSRDRGQNQPISQEAYEVAVFIRNNPGLSTHAIIKEMGISRGTFLSRILGISSVLPVYEEYVHGRAHWYYLEAHK